MTPKPPRSRHISLFGVRLAVGICLAIRLCLAVQVSLHPTLPGVVTDPSLSNFDIYGKGIGPRMFVVVIIGDANAYANLTLEYIVRLRPDGEAEQIVYHGLSSPFSLSPGEIVSLPSNDFLEENNPAVKTSITSTLQELPEGELKESIVTSQQLPDGELVFSIRLLQNGNPLTGQNTADESRHTIVNASYITLVAPGANITGSPPVLSDPNPVFVWMSDIIPAHDPGFKAFAFELFQQRTGQSPADAITGIPVFRREVDEYQLRYPETAVRLIPGATYCWIVTGRLRAVTITEVHSSIYSFTYIPQPNPEVVEIKNLLRMITGDEVLQEVAAYNSDARIVVDGQQVTVHELRDLVNRILGGEFSVMSTSAE